MKTTHKLPLVSLVTLSTACTAVDASPVETRSLSQALVVAASPTCSVEVGQVSYDDPGSDDAEYVQLVVRGLERRDAATHDAAVGGRVRGCGEGGASADAAAPPRAPTLGDCGLETLDLLNGGADGCPAYRSLDLASAPIPEDGIVVVCSEDSLLAADARCDVTHAGTRKLPNGWLQNGPGDGLRFVATDDRVTELAYEEAPDGCFAATPVALVAEAGEGADGADDVNVSCAGVFELRSGNDVSPTVEVRCGRTSDGPDASTLVGLRTPPGGVDAAAWSVAAAADDGTIEQQSASTEPGPALLSAADGGEAPESEVTLGAPSIGCRFAPSRRLGSGAGTLTLLSLALLCSRVRRRALGRVTLAE